MPRDVISRREFTALAAAGAAAALVPRALRAAAYAAAGAWPEYDRAIVIDCLATPGPFNVPNMFAAPWTDTMVANARA